MYFNINVYSLTLLILGILSNRLLSALNRINNIKFSMEFSTSFMKFFNITITMHFHLTSNFWIQLTKRQYSHENDPRTQLFGDAIKITQFKHFALESTFNVHTNTRHYQSAWLAKIKWKMSLKEPLIFYILKHGYKKINNGRKSTYSSLTQNKDIVHCTRTIWNKTRGI